MQEEKPAREAVRTAGGKEEEEITATSHPAAQSSEEHRLSSYRQLYQATSLPGVSLALFLPLIITGKVVSPLADEFQPVSHLVLLYFVSHWASRETWPQSEPWGCEPSHPSTAPQNTHGMLHPVLAGAFTMINLQQVRVCVKIPKAQGNPEDKLMIFPTSVDSELPGQGTAGLSI